MGLVAALVALAMFVVGSGGASAATSHSKAAAPQKAQSGASVPVTGSADNGEKLTGTFTPKKFQVQKGQLWSRGTLQGKIGDKSFQKTVKLPVKAVNADGSTATSGGPQAAAAPSAAADCNVLNLVLGPLDLNLLGLQVHLDQVVLDITAVPGAGNLLGNLLCSVAGLLDGGGLGGLNGLLTQLQGLLNQILGVLGGLSL